MNKAILFLVLLNFLVTTSCTNSGSRLESIVAEDIYIPLDSKKILEDSVALDSFMNVQKSFCVLEDNGESNSDTSIEIEPYISFIFIVPDSTYKYSTSSYSLVDLLQKDLESAGIRPLLKRDTTVIEADILHDYSNFKGFVRYYKQIGLIKEDSFYFLVFPEGVKFLQELDNNGRRISKIHGSALSIISEAGFIREESANTHILTHELAHFFGLRHIFQESGKDDGVLGLSCTTGDLIADTPYVPSDNKVVYLDKGTCNMYTVDTLYPEKFKKIVMHNFTSYSDQRCMSSFTELQVKTMRNNLLTYAQLENKLKNYKAKIDYSKLLYQD